MKRKGNSGVYIIQNLINNKIYIGASTTIYSRLLDHISALRRDNHINSHLQESYNFYGEFAFIFETLEECDEEYIFSQENYWCNLLNTHNREFGYNIDPTSPKGKCAVSDETRAKMGNNRKDKREVYCYTIYGDFHRKFKDLYECGRYFNTAAANIHRKMNIISNKKNLIDSDITRFILLDKDKDISKIKNHWDNIFLKISNSSGKYRIYDCFNNFRGSINSSELAKLLNSTVSSISGSINRNTYVKSLKITK